MNSTDTVQFTKVGFDTPKYFKLQRDAIIDRISKFQHGRLYLEIGGKFLFDPHAARVLPGFDAQIKQKIFADLINHTAILFCVDWQGIVSDRQLKNTEESYQKSIFDMLKEIEKNLKIKPIVMINRCRRSANEEVESFIAQLRSKKYEVYKRYYIAGYPENVKEILSEDGFGKDDYVPLDKKLVLVTGAASNSGKLSTCLGQVFHDNQNGLISGYAKYELFPIWNLPLDHPVNLAYEASTVDIGDYNVVDKDHMSSYKMKSTNYNRDVEAFKILKRIADKFVDESNYIRKYQSPTDMGISMAGFAITDDNLVCLASLAEIQRRIQWYQEIVERGDGKKTWVTKTEGLLREALNYIAKKEKL